MKMTYTRTPKIKKEIAAACGIDPQRLTVKWGTGSARRWLTVWIKDLTVDERDAVYRFVIGANYGTGEYASEDGRNGDSPTVIIYDEPSTERYRAMRSNDWKG